MTFHLPSLDFTFLRDLLGTHQEDAPKDGINWATASLTDHVLSNFPEGHRMNIRELKAILEEAHDDDAEVFIYMGLDLKKATTAYMQQRHSEFNLSHIIPHAILIVDSTA